MTRFVRLMTLTLIVWGQQVESMRRIVHFDRVEVVKTGAGSPFTFSEIDIFYNETYGSAFNLDMFIARDVISTKLTFAIELVRCASKEALDTCEFFSVLHPPNACVFLNTKNMAWNVITDSFTPVVRCPFHKGTYLGRSISFDYNKWQVFPLHEWYWKITTRLFEDKLLLFAFLVEANFIPYRNRTVA